jgi:uncharacterized protein
MTTAASSAGSPTSSDRELVVTRLGRRPFTDYRVAVRCLHGRPAVLSNAPRDLRGRPFPTRDWLLDPALDEAVSRLEAAGGVRMLERDAAMAHHLAAAHARHAAAHAGYRVAGAGDPRYVKCLHAHLAFALAEGGNPVGDWIMVRADIAWPGDCCGDTGPEPGDE